MRDGARDLERPLAFVRGACPCSLRQLLQGLLLGHAPVVVEIEKIMQGAIGRRMRRHQVRAGEVSQPATALIMDAVFSLVGHVRTTLELPHGVPHCPMRCCVTAAHRQGRIRARQAAP